MTVQNILYMMEQVKISIVTDISIHDSSEHPV